VIYLRPPPTNFSSPALFRGDIFGRALGQPPVLFDTTGIRLPALPLMPQDLNLKKV
jgi:hypothetical protein